MSEAVGVLRGYQLGLGDRETKGLGYEVNGRVVCGVDVLHFACMAFREVRVCVLW